MAPANSDSEVSDQGSEPNMRIGPSEKVYSCLYIDMSDQGSPPPPNGVPLPSTKSSANSRAKGKSKPKPKLRKHRFAPKPKVEPATDSDSFPAYLNGPVVDGFATDFERSAPNTPVGKPSKSQARTRILHNLGPGSKYDSNDDLVVDCNGNDVDMTQDTASDGDAAQDGRGNPNLSGISPPLPKGLVKPELQGYETGFHVVTTGTEVGICLFKAIAESYLDCRSPSMATFTTWEKAHSYYKICFVSGAVHIREPPSVYTPTHSPARKKQKFREALPVSKAPTQPHFAPAMNSNASLGSPSLSSGQHSPLVFPESPELAAPANNSKQTQATTSDIVEQLAQIINSRKRPHHGAQPTAQTLTPQSLPPRVLVVDSSDDSITAASGATSSEDGNYQSYRDAVALPASTSLLVVEFHSDPPAPLKDDSSVIVISDSEEELLDPDTEGRSKYLRGGVQKPGPTPRSHRPL